VTPAPFADLFRAVADGLSAVRAGRYADIVLERVALPHIEAIEAGLIATARCTGTRVSEWRVLVRQAGITDAPLSWTPDGVAAAAEQARPHCIVPADAMAVSAAAHAMVAWALLPSLPGDCVAVWPGISLRRTYADILPPDGPGAALARAEEMERLLWDISLGRDPDRRAMRRTTAFFEAGARLDMTGAFA
jgi:hypothetical protein